MRLVLIAAAVSALAAPAAAQSWGGYNTGYGHHRQDGGWDVRSQYDRPGDYRCDAFWDANRDDCGARWRDQRHRSSWNTGYGHRGYDYGYGQRGYGYGYGSRRGYGHDGGAAYYGAYGRPDLVYGGGYGRGHGYSYGGARDPRRIDWCRASYRSYDPSSGYYRAYSGRLIWCG